MAEYKYTATNQEGVIISRTILADNEDEVESALHREGLILVNLKVIPEAEPSLTDRIFKKVSDTDKAQFLEYFASMLEAGLTINDVLDAFYEDLDKPLLRKFVKDTQLGLRNGRRLSECFEAHPELFPQLYVGMIKVGEASGTLAESLRHLANQLKKSNELKSKVRGAMIYPIILFTTLTVVVFVLLVFVFPRVQDFFKTSNLELPAITIVMLNISKVVQNYWFVLLLILPLIIYLNIYFSKNYVGFRLWKSKLSLRIPIVGPLNRAMNVALFTRTFGSLLSSGVNILESVDVVKASLKNEVYRSILDTIREDLLLGNTLADSLKKYPEYFSPFEVRVLAISERTGEVASGLASIAEFYEVRTYALLGNVTAAIEPIMMLSMGGIVVAVAMSVITPIFQLMSNVTNFTKK